MFCYEIFVSFIWMENFNDQCLCWNFNVILSSVQAHCDIAFGEGSVLTRWEVSWNVYLKVRGMAVLRENPHVVASSVLITPSICKPQTCLVIMRRKITALWVGLNQFGKPRRWTHLIFLGSFALDFSYLSYWHNECLGFFKLCNHSTLCSIQTVLLKIYIFWGKSQRVKITISITWTRAPRS